MLPRYELTDDCNISLHLKLKVFYFNRGANDARELGFMHYDGGNIEGLENEYNKGYESALKDTEL